MFHRAKQKTFGCHVVRVQRIFLKKDRFGSPIYKYVKHGAMVKSLPKQEEA